MGLRRMSDFTIELLPPDQIRSAYPLIREALPGLDLVGWLRFARQTAAARRAGRSGIVAARRVGRPYPCGLFCYRIDQDVEQGRVLIAEHFVAVDLLEPAVVLAALVAAPSALCELDIRYSDLGDGMRPLFAALAASTTLRRLDCSRNDISAECAREHILPAVRANASMRELSFGQGDIQELVEAEAIVAARRR